MDVVGFVGFAASGPLNMPVMVEDYADFLAIFGRSARLAWDPSAGSYAQTLLGPAVQAFFAGGGRRAYVIRVAGSGAERARHPVPGLLTAADDDLQTAELVARAYGSWADTLTVGAALTSEPTVLTQLALEGDPTLVLRGRASISAGDLLRVWAGSWTGYLPVRLVAAAPSGSPIGGIEQVVQVDLQRSLWLKPDLSPGGRLGALDIPWSSLSPGDTVERLSLELLVRGELGEDWVLTDLGFLPEHSRYLGSLPTDEDFFAPREPLRGPVPELWSAVADPRFPLAAARGDALYYPVGVEVVPEAFLAAATSDSAALERDGLGLYGEGLFLDDELRDVVLDTVLATADYIRWQAPVPRTLNGVHALLDVDEVTVVAAPDAAQLPWRAEPPKQAPEPPPSPPDPTVPAGCRRAPFADCAPADLGPAPKLSLISHPDGVVELRWTSSAEPGVVYRLQVTTDSTGWDRARDIYLGNELSRAFHGSVSEHRFYRVRAESAILHTTWSNGVAVVADTGLRHVVEPATEYMGDRLLAIHRCLLRMCAARGDLLAVLSLPEHYRGSDAIAHAERLRSAVDVASSVAPLGVGEQRALGFGALYHPWLGSGPDGTSTAVKWAPPDGAVSGIIARRALARGAWVAPANEQLTRVVALRRRESDDLLPALQTAQVNALRQTPRGFVCLAEDTLIIDRQLRPVNVRRLFSLIRRLAALEGTRYVFEPNDPTLRRAVERGFTDVFAFLFRLGAFAGRTPEQAFRVVVGDPPNTAQSIERGRLIVELKFAPAQPLEFLMVRLIQTGEHGFTLAVS